MKKNLIYILGIIVALLILFSGWFGELKAIESGSREGLMFNSNNEIRRSVINAVYRFARYTDIIQQTATKTETGYVAIEYVPKGEHDYGLTNE